MGLFGARSTIKAANELGKTVFSGLDELATSKEEKLELWREFSKQLLETQVAAAQESTLRHQNDMTSDSWLSKNVRPMVLIFLLLLYLTTLLIDTLAPAVDIKPVYIDILEELLKLAISFYFVSRMGQHISKSTTDIFKTRRQRRQEEQNSDSDDP